VTVSYFGDCFLGVNKVSSFKEWLLFIGGTKHWEKPRTEPAVATDQDVWRAPYSRSRSVDIEMTAYALLVYSSNRDMSNALPIAKWIIAQRNPDGGFTSTQVLIPLVHHSLA